MRNGISMFVYSIFCIIFLSLITQAQNSLTHNTGTLEVTIIDNGYIGDNGSGNFGGVVYNGNQNAMHTAGFSYGALGAGFGNFGIGNIEDFYNFIPIAGFFSIPYFNEHAYYTASLYAFPSSRTFAESFSNTGENFVFIKTTISDNINNMNDLQPGLYADWDVGNYLLNRGGYDPSRNLFYVYENDGGTDSSFYGIMGIGIDGESMAPNTMKGIITDSFTSSRAELYNFMTSTAFDTITIDGNYRIYTCCGPFVVPVGSTITLDYAIVSGTSLADLLVNAQAAIDYGLLVPVEDATSTTFDFLLLHNYPNPFNPTTTIKYKLPASSKVTLKIYDVLGNEVATLLNEEKEAGTYEFILNASNYPSGVYFYRLNAGSFVETKKMVLLR